MLQVHEKQIGIIGIGVVGSAIQAFYKKQYGYQIHLYDKFKEIGSQEEINLAKFIFICVPTPYDPDTGFDSSALEEVFGWLDGHKIVIIKSTVLPGTTDRLQEEYPQHKIIHSPEFLKERSAKQDFAYQKRQVLGYTTNSEDILDEVATILPSNKHSFRVPAKVAEMAKYVGNVFLASKVIFANGIYDLCEAAGVEYKTMIEIVKADSRIGTSHFDPLFDGYRGYAGKCFKKDMETLIDFARQMKTPLFQQEITHKINNNLLGIREETLAPAKPKSETVQLKPEPQREPGLEPEPEPDSLPEPEPQPKPKRKSQKKKTKKKVV